MLTAKTLRLISLLPRRRVILDRVASVLQDRFERISIKAPTYQSMRRKRLFSVSGELAVNLNGLIAESALRSIEAMSGRDRDLRLMHPSLSQC